MYLEFLVIDIIQIIGIIVGRGNGCLLFKIVPINDMYYITSYLHIITDCIVDCKKKIHHTAQIRLSAIHNADEQVFHHQRRMSQLYQRSNNKWPINRAAWTIWATDHDYHNMHRYNKNWQPILFISNTELLANRCCRACCAWLLLAVMRVVLSLWTAARHEDASALSNIYWKQPKYYILWSSLS